MNIRGGLPVEYPMPNSQILRWTGIALASGGVLTFLINAALTPALVSHAPFSHTAASSLFLWRQGASALAAALLLFGAVGVYLCQADRLGSGGLIAFVMALLGSSLLLATEWAEIFLVHTTLAVRAPDALNAMNSAHGMNFYDIGSMAALGLFMLGWLAMAAVSMKVGVLARGAVGLMIAGLIAIPMLSAALGMPWGPIAGNAILGAGWVWMGLEVRRRGRPATR